MANFKITYELTVYISESTAKLEDTVDAVGELIDAVGELIDSHLHKNFAFEDLEMRAIRAVEE